MKKLFTFLLALGTIASVQAQTTKDEARRVILGGGNNSNSKDKNGEVVYDRNGNGTYDDRARQEEIDRVNYEYDRRIQEVRNNPNLSTAEKERRIYELERQRRAEVKAINERYGRNGSYEGDRKNKKYKKNGNNGKHLGWEKGKGNPHRTGQWPGNSSNAKNKGDHDKHEKSQKGPKNKNKNRNDD